MLTVTQKRILEICSINGRLTNKEVAKSVGVSEDTVAYQITKLQTKGYAHFFAFFDAHCLGYTQYHFLFQITSDTIDLEVFNKIPNVISINDCIGKYDVQLVVQLKDEREVEAVITQIESLCESKQITVLKMIDNIRHMDNVIFPLQLNTKIKISSKNAFSKYMTGRFVGDQVDALYSKNNLSLDASDKKIVAALLHNPRASLAQIAKSVPLTSEAIKYRIKKYYENNFLLNVGLMHNFKKYGLYASHLLLKIDGITQEFKDFLAKNPRVFYAPQLFGEYNCMIYLLIESPELIGPEIRKIRSFLGNSLDTFDLLIADNFPKALGFPETELQ